MIGDVWSFFRNFFSSNLRSRKIARSRANRDGRGAFLRGEQLERRELLSANQIYFQAAASEITIEGTTGADTVNVWTDASNMVHVTMDNALGNQSAVFNRSVVAQVRFSGGDGNDFFKNISNVNSLVTGDAGNDILLGGFGNNFIFGGIGDDSISGNSGADELRGDDGNDQLDAGAGNDTLIGGLGNDTLNGSDGDDNLFGSEGIDTLNGGGPEMTTLSAVSETTY